jgi:group I intron endonuclease
MKFSAIYAIVNQQNGKKYVGSAFALGKRWTQHVSNLRHGRHRNTALQNAWNKYGEHQFELVVLEIVENKDLILIREQHWIDATKCCEKEFGYNICEVAGSCKGNSDEVRKRISEIKKGQKRRCSEETRKRISESKKKSGYVMSQETRAKLSKANKGRQWPGRTPSEAGKLRIAAAHKGNSYRLGIAHTEESRRKISEAGKGRKWTEATRAKRVGMVRSEEAKRKTSESLKATWAKRKAAAAT